MTVGILGCGWLGLPLGKYLAEQGYEVKGTTTQPEKLERLASAGIQPFLIRLEPHATGDSLNDFLQVDQLIVNIPPRAGKQGPEFHPEQIRNLASALAKAPVQHILHISSTSVYPDLNREAREEDANAQGDPSAEALLQAESLLLALRPAKSVTILRCGGLMGDDRIPAKYVAGKAGLTNGHIPVNFIHREDVIGIIAAVLDSGIRNEILNVVAPLHPTRREVYLASAAATGYPPPSFAPDEALPFKIINTDKLQRLLSYTFRFPDPRAFSYRR